MRTLLLLVVALLWFAPAGAAEPGKSAPLAIVLLSEPRLPDAKSFRAELEKRLAGRHAVSDLDTNLPQTIFLRVAGGYISVGLIDLPVQTGEIDGLCRSAWYWRQACEATAAHKAHVIVAVLGTGLDMLDASLLLTDVVASLMDTNAIASHWGTSLQSREAFLRQSARISRDRPPVWLWVNFRVSQEAGKGMSLSTDGMEAFGLREIEAKDVSRPGSEVFTLLAGLAQYLISKGPVIQDGDTVGDSAALNIRVRQGPSYWRDGLTVYRVIWPR